MTRYLVIIATSAVLTTCGTSFGQDASPGSPFDLSTLPRRQTLTQNWLGLGQAIEQYGISVSLGLTQVHQNVLSGPVRRRRVEAYTGSYNLDVQVEPDKLTGWKFLEGGSICIAAEGSWGVGIDGTSIGSIFGANGDAAGDRFMDVMQFWYQQELFGGKLRIRAGKMDITGGFSCKGSPAGFDGNAMANDETTQFLNAALVNNPTIPFPDYGLGVAVYLEPFEGFYIAAGITDAQADARETGFNTTFHDEDYFVSFYETGIVTDFKSAKGPLRGTYRAGMWYNGQPMAKVNGSDRSLRDKIGTYLSFDQILWKENSDTEDSQGLGAFFRYGLSDSDVGDPRTFYSAGVQYRGLIPTRNDDVLGVGWATGVRSRQSGATGDESVIEAYYNIRIAPWLNITPSVQYISNPGGSASTDNAAVLGLRMQISF
ncbi:MAG: carbohydrate porin [Phycisphaerae bacterium]|jgi:carbohydrate-selective porin OprB|nr:carbohydrate porin [Phycisphaerae bacterium]